MTREFIGRVYLRRNLNSPIILASDASCNESIAAGSYIASTGHWGLFHQAWDKSLWTTRYIDGIELLALYRGLSRLITSREVPSDKPIIAYVDNKRAARFAQLWLSGSLIRVPLRLTNQTQVEHLETMQQQFASWSDRVQIYWIRRKSGNNLHDAADQLARLALHVNNNRGGPTAKSARSLVTSSLKQKAS